MVIGNPITGEPISLASTDIRAMESMREQKPIALDLGTTNLVAGNPITGEPFSVTLNSRPPTSRSFQIGRTQRSTNH